jgi:hypothetical protein
LSTRDKIFELRSGGLKTDGVCIRDIVAEHRDSSAMS